MQNFISKLKLHFSSPDQIIRDMVYLLIVLIPLVYSTEVKSVFVAPKLFLLRVSTLIMLLVLGVDFFRKREEKVVKTKTSVFILIYGFILVLSTIFSTHFWTSVLGNQGRFLGIFTMLNFILLYFIVLRSFQKKEQIEKAIYLSVVMAIIIGLWAVLQNQGLVGTKENWTIDPELRAFATFGHSNHFGAYLAFNIMLLLGILNKFKSLWWKLFLLAGAVIMFLSIIATASRGALLALIGAVFVFFAFLILKNKTSILSHWKKLIAFMIAITIISAIFYQPIWEKIKNLQVIQRSVSTVEFIKQGNVPDRISWWYSSIAMIKDRPIFGHGLSTFKDVYNKYRRTDYRVPGNEQDEKLPESAHMEYFNTAATQGLFGLSAYLLFIGAFIFALVKLIYREKENFYIPLGILTAVLTYLIQVSLSFGEVATLFFLYLFIALGMSWKIIAAKAEGENISEWKISLKSNYIILPLIIIGVVLGLNYSYKNLRAEYFYRIALAADRLERYEDALTFYDLSQAASPHEYVYPSSKADTFYAAALNAAEKNGDFPLVSAYLNISIEASLQALEIMPMQPHITANLALTYFKAHLIYKDNAKLVLADEFYKKTIEMYERTIENSPNNPLYLYGFGQIYMISKDYEKAIEKFERALQIRPDHSEAIDALEKAKKAVSQG